VFLVVVLVVTLSAPCLLFRLTLYLFKDNDMAGLYSIEVKHGSD
jgi:hypothetical protein